MPSFASARRCSYLATVDQPQLAFCPAYTSLIFPWAQVLQASDCLSEVRHEVLKKGKGCSAGDVLATVGVPVDKQQLLAVAPGLDQIGSVFEEVISCQRLPPPPHPPPPIDTSFTCTALG